MQEALGFGSHLVARNIVMSCPFRDYFGIPGQGFHFHVFGIAILDTLATWALAWMISVLLTSLWTLGLGNRPRKFSPIPVFGLLLVVATLIHYRLCVETTLTELVVTFVTTLTKLVYSVVQ